jgi:hypothetical protein
MRGDFEAYQPLSSSSTLEVTIIYRFRLPIIALVLSLAAITLVILNNLVMCRRILFCASTVVSFPDGVNLVQNGGFRSRRPATQYGRFYVDPRRQLSATNWEVQGVKGFLACRYGHFSRHHSGFLDLTGGNDKSKDGFFAAVQQTFPFEI